MHRLIPIALTLILALSAAQPAAAGGERQREVERMTQQFERLFQPLMGAVEARDLVFTRHPNGFKSLSYRLDLAQRDEVRSRAAADDFFQTLACGHMAAEPTTPASVVSALISDLETRYNFWFAVINMSDVEETRRTSVRITGPEEFEIAASDPVVYPANQLFLFWFNPDTPFPATGVYTHRVVVRGGGKVSYKFFAEEARTTTLER